ncbi:MAG: DNA helicase II [Gammaproteobacteria bacterium]|nr:MAG: DNA helicase II [Gammaproteobacteria bacterium]
MVGDDDQSIYGWRGAKIENIQRISDDFPNVAIHRLEQNYRSTSTILDAANSIIVNNPDRLGKKLWTAGEQGDPILLYCAYNEIDEARYVVERIAKYVEEDTQRTEIAILYRSNAQSRVFEEALINRGIPYRVYGGLRFFERAEIKDSLAYMRLIANRHDDASFERVINTPTRGIGDRSVETIREYARNNNCSMWAAARDIVESNLMAARAKNAIAGFITLINEIAVSAGEIKLHELVAVMLDKAALRSHFEKDKTDKGQAKVENINELINAARGFEQETDAEQSEHLQMFLTNAALEAGEGQGSEWEDCVQLMTLHSAKGLEFRNVFIVGMEQGLFPSQMAVGRQQGLDEERRLCYVGITRARKLLHMSYAESRRIYGKDTFCTRSRFLDEISPELIEEVRPAANPYQLASTSSLDGFSTSSISNKSESKYSLGQGVNHAKFGEGVVINTEGKGSSQMVQVMFASCGEKWLLADKANLEVI